MKRRIGIIKMYIQYGFMDIMGNMDRMVDIVHYGPSINCLLIEDIVILLRLDIPLARCYAVVGVHIGG